VRRHHRALLLRFACTRPRSSSVPSGQLPKVVADRSIEDTIARADDALHIAKTNRRNRTSVNL
jgi:hypothetical protein